MTLSEFKAWFEGYTEGLEVAPTKAQFERIKEKVKLIDGAPIVQTIWLDHYRRYYPHYVPYWGQQPYLGGVMFGANNGDFAATQAFNQYNDAVNARNIYAPNGDKPMDSVTQTFDAYSAMYALGKAEAAN